MRPWTRCWVLAVVACLAAAGCGKGSDDGKHGKKAADSDTDSSSDSSGDDHPMTAEEQAAAMEKAAKDAKETYKQLNGGKDIKAVEAKELKALLPAEIAGAKRGSVESQHTNTMGMDISTTNASYDPPPLENDDGTKPRPRFRVTITDLGNASGTMAMGYTSWAMTSFERETDTGYEKTVKYNGFPGMESYDRESKDGKMHVFVAKRFVVEVTANDATLEQLHGAMDAIDTGKLGSLGK